MTTYDVPEWVSPAEAAAHFRCGQKAVYAGVANGTIPSIRLGRRIRIPLRKIEETTDRQIATSSAPGVASEDADEELPAEEGST